MSEYTVSPQTLAKLEQAMERLLAGQPLRTNGLLTKNNLYLEAGVSRATMNRAPDLLAQWESAVNAGPRPTPTPESEEIKRLRRELRKAKESVDRMTQEVQAAATVIQALHSENLQLRATRDRMQRRTVSPLMASDRDRNASGPAPA